MEKMRKVAFAALLATLLGGFAWMVLRQREPVYRGKPLRHWLEVVATENGGPEADEQAREAIKKIGTNALPTLVQMMQAKDSPLKFKLADWANELLGIHFDFKTASELHWFAASGFQLLGSDAKPAIPRLIKLLPEDDSGSVASALSYVGSNGVVALVAALTNPDPNVRIRAARALADIGFRRTFQPWLAPDKIAQLDTEIKMAVPTLIKLLKDPSDQVRAQAAFALSAVSPQHAETVVPALIGTLQDPANFSGSSTSAVSAAHALARFEEKAQAAVPALLSASQQSPNPTLQSAAAQALKAIDPEAAAKAGVK